MVVTASRAAEESRDGLDIDESRLMGGGDDDITARLQKIREHKERKADEKNRSVDHGGSLG